jgi:OOP family OmpA-OmpF porin
MKKVSVIVLVVVGLLFAAYAEAANPKRRTRNANRIGPYAGALISMNSYPGDQSAAEADLQSSFDGVPTQDLRIGTDDKDVGYAAQFGYRFTRYIAVEFALAQYGDLRSSAHADVDLGSGFVPASINLNFHSGGPQLSVLGILPINDKFELYGRAGLLFASSEREFVIKVDGDTSSFGSSKGESTEVVLGLGAAFHVNQMFSIRAQVEKLDKVGEPARTGTEDITSASLGLVVRF